MIEDEIVKQFLKNQNDDFFKEAKTKTAFLLRDYNFNLEVLPQIMKDLREIKKNDEILLLRKAIAISVIGQVEVMKAIKPKMSEREIQGIHEFVYRKYGAADQGYPSIVGAGENGCVLHYIENEKKELDNELVLMDLGAEVIMVILKMSQEQFLPMENSVKNKGPSMKLFMRHRKRLFKLQ